MKILAIETSCDETGAAVVEFEEVAVKLISNSLASSLALHAQTGGIIPEHAAREQIKYIIPTIFDSLEKAGIKFDKNNVPKIDALAVTYGPGLIGSLLVGVETVKTLSYIWNKPLIPVNHLFGHIYANFIRENSQPLTQTQLPTFPLIALIVSGGHTDLVLMKSHTDVVWIGGTRDDAAGEAYDKIGRLLNIEYPAGPKIEMLAKEGNPKAFQFPRPLLHDGGYDFSFSGLKTAVLREVQKITMQTDSHSDTKKINITDTQTIKDLCRGSQDAIIDVLVQKTLKAAIKFDVKSIILSGGVSANKTLRDEFIRSMSKYSTLNVKLFVPEKFLCTDNAAMIGAAACFRNKKIAWEEIAADPQLYFD